MPSVLDNMPNPIAKFSKRMRRAIAAGVSHDAIDATQPAAYKREDKQVVTKKAGKKHRFGRRIIDYKRVGPLQRQIGVRYLHGEAWPIMQTYFTHKLLHATKGWRKYTGGAGLCMPTRGLMNNTPYPQRFFGRNHIWA